MCLKRHVWLAALLACVSGCSHVSGGTDTFCLIYRPLPGGSLGSVEISRAALAAIADNEVAYAHLCGG